MTNYLDHVVAAEDDVVLDNLVPWDAQHGGSIIDPHLSFLLHQRDGWFFVRTRIERR